MTRFENVGVFIRGNSLSLLAQAVFQPNVFPYKYTKILRLSHSSYLPAYEDGTGSVPKRRHIKFRRRGIT
jgi:hypothetical protein